MFGPVISNSVITQFVQQRVVHYLVINKCLLLSALIFGMKVVTKLNILPPLHIFVTST